MKTTIFENAKQVTIHKLVNLQTALAECGIEADIFEDDGNLILSAELWNCIDGTDVTFGVYATQTDDYEEIDHYAQPNSDSRLNFSNEK